MKALIYSLILLGSFYTFSQNVVVDANQTASQLVNLVVNNSCLELTNTNMSSGQSVAYFNKNNSNFPLSEGVVLRNGNATFTAGSYSNSNLSSPLNTNTDSFLQNLSNQSSGQTTAIRDVAFLEFDFTPAFNSFSFDFLFASNEYGEYQCISNDVFAFILTDLTTGVSTNLALIPGTSEAISVRNIRNAAYNGTCTSSNPGYFSTFTPTNPVTAAINMRGYTTVMTAASSVIPNRAYKIRIAIADYGDADYDSAVFIGAGTFETTFDIGPDQIICEGDTYELNSGLDATYTHQWYKNDILISSATSATYTVTGPATYKVVIDKGSCHIEDTIIFNPLNVTPPKDLTICDSGASTYTYDLTLNNETYLTIDPSVYDLYYYTSTDNITNTNPIAISELNNFQSNGNQTIYIKIFNTTTSKFCDAVYTFQLKTSAIEIVNHPNASICENELSYSLSQLNPTFSAGLPIGTVFSFYTSEANAIANVNAISSVTNSNQSPLNLWVRATLNSNNAVCFDVASFTVTINPSPIVDEIEDVIECEEYILPQITNGVYYKLSGGPTVIGQEQFAIGDSINEEGTYYIFSGPNENGCTNESNFDVLLIHNYKPIEDNCGVFKVPTPLYGIGKFYTALGGPSGGGSIIPVGTEFENTTDQTIIQNIYFYSDIDGVTCVDKMFEIYIHPLPVVDTVENVITCDSYVLPPLTNGNYFTGANGTGTALFTGNIVNATSRIYIYNQINHVKSDGEMGFCGKQSSFQITIIPTSIYTPKVACGEWKLPAVPVGGYFDQPLGQGNAIPANSLVTVSQTVYYYAQTTTTPNCTEGLSYQITINPRPIVDVLPNVVACGEYILPSLTHGTYYKKTGGPNVAGQVAYTANQVVDLSGTALSPGLFYIFAPENEFGCTNESSFRVTINPLPIVDNVLDRIECLPYSIPTPTNGTVYTAPNGPNGTGTLVTNTMTFEQDKTFYLYRENPTTGCKSDVMFTVFYNGISLPNFPNVAVCEYENYTLTPIVHSPIESYSSFSLGYFYETGGQNPIPPGTVFNTPNTSTTIYIHAINEGRFGVTCIEEKSFVITVSKTPVLPSFAAVNGNYCGQFTLPTLPTYDYNINYYSAPGGAIENLITTPTFTVNPGETPVTKDFWVFGHANNNRNCNDETHFQVTIYPLLTFEMQGGYICVDPETKETISGFMIESGLPSSDFQVDWYLNNQFMGTGANYFATETGVYTAQPSKITPEIAPNCNYVPATVEILASSTAIATATVTQPFEEVSDIIVTIESGLGSYEYQLDNGNYQSSPEFSNVSSGIHTITVNDTLGNCGAYTFDVIVVKYPKFFTPNNDGYNDVWNIVDLKTTQPDAKIHIYDRYGKLIKEIAPNTNGWDGTYNGTELPSTDYWFTIDYIYEGNPKQFKANFSMKK